MNVHASAQSLFQTFTTKTAQRKKAPATKKATKTARPLMAIGVAPLLFDVVAAWEDDAVADEIKLGVEVVPLLVAEPAVPAAELEADGAPLLADVTPLGTADTSGRGVPLLAHS